MNDETIMNNYLMLLKSSLEVYIHGTIECANNSSRNIMKKMLDKTLKEQSNTFDIMSKFNYYKMNNINSSLIEEKLNKF